MKSNGYCWRIRCGEILSRSCRGCQGSEGGSPGFGPGTFGQPSVHPGDIHGDDSNHMLKLGLGQPDIATSAQAEGAHRLGQSALDARPLAISGTPRFRLLLATNILQGFVQRARTQRDFAGVGLGSGAEGTAVTSGTGGAVKPNVDRVVAPRIADQRPVDAGPTGRADHLFGLPVDGVLLASLTLLANSRSGHQRCQSANENRFSSFSRLDPRKPRPQTDQIHRCGNRDVLEARFGLPPIAAAA